MTPLDEHQPDTPDDDSDAIGWLLDDDTNGIPEPPSPFNWDTLAPEDLADAWYALDGWVDWLRRTYALPVSVLPPAWHRHSELVWELSALHLSWQSAYHPEQHPSAPLGWHRDFAEAQRRLRDWIAASGTGLDHDQPTRHTPWPGEPPDDPPLPRPLTDRTDDFHDHVTRQVAHRRTTRQPQEETATR